jgi:hypothetical protein
MLAKANALQWNGQPGHYEVYYLTATEPRSGVGLWIRYTMLAPDEGEPSCALWFVVTGPRKLARKQTLPIASLHTRPDPFELCLGDAWLNDGGMSGAFEDVEWELRWRSPGGSYEHVHPLLRRMGAAQTILVLPHADLAVTGHVVFAGERLELEGVRGGQAHLWGSKHATRWAWAHCNDFTTGTGQPVPDLFVDGVSVAVPRFGLQIGPSTPVVGRIDGRDFISTAPVRVISNRSRFQIGSWRFEALDRRHKLIGEVEVDPELLAGVTYQDPDGEPAYCYNSEVASMRLQIFERAARPRTWKHRRTLVAPGRAHFECGQRSPVPGLELLIR